LLAWGCSEIAKQKVANEHGFLVRETKARVGKKKTKKSMIYSEEFCV